MLMQGAQMGSNSNYSWMRRSGTSRVVEMQRKYEEARQQMEFQQSMPQLGFTLDYLAGVIFEKHWRPPG